MKFVFELLESMISWKNWKVRREAICIAGTILEVILVDDEVFARAGRTILSMIHTNNSEKMDEAAAEKQKLDDFLCS